MASMASQAGQMQGQANKLSNSKKKSHATSYTFFRPNIRASSNGLNPTLSLSVFLMSAGHKFLCNGGNHLFVGMAAAMTMRLSTGLG